MIVISEQNSEIMRCIGRQEFYSWKQYKKLAYVLSLDVPDGTVWYNLLTREIIFFNRNEEEKAHRNKRYVVNWLVSHWFMIPIETDDKTIVHCFWQMYNTRHPVKQGRPLTLATIFTTTECNARCPYCYEYGTEKNTMTEETASAVAEYIVKNSSPKLLLKWFGGEPLVNYKVMDIICQKLALSGKEFSSYIVSNAYLFDRVSDEQIVNVWKIKQAQITIDGTRDNYIQIKGLPKDSYDKVLNSIERLAKLKINVMIRSHITEENADDLKKLVTELGNRFSGLGDNIKYIHLYVAPLFENLENNLYQLTSEKRSGIYDALIEIDKMIFKYGLSHGKRVPKIKQTHCMADNGKSIVITPTGDLTPCEHCHDREIIGSVFDNALPEIPEKWFERTEEIQECQKCFYYPQCVKLKMCEAESPCNEENRRLMKYNAEQIMLNLYEQFRKRRKNAEINRMCKKRSGI